MVSLVSYVKSELERSYKVTKSYHNVVYTVSLSVLTNLRRKVPNSFADFSLRILYNLL